MARLRLPSLQHPRSWSSFRRSSSLCLGIAGWSAARRVRPTPHQHPPRAPALDAPPFAAVQGAGVPAFQLQWQHLWAVLIRRQKDSEPCQNQGTLSGVQRKGSGRNQLNPCGRQRGSEERTPSAIGRVFCSPPACMGTVLSSRGCVKS